MKNLKILVSAMLLFAVLAGMGYAFTPPPPPPPPVPQTIGLYDTSIGFLVTSATDQSACRQCHQSTGTNIPNGNSYPVGGVDTRHHGLVQRGVTNPLTNTPFGCTDCHPSTGGAGVLLDHSCVDCHNGTKFWADAPNPLNAHVGNFSRPHHVITNYTEVANFGNPAANRTCNVCHGSFVDNYNDGHYVPSYATSFDITPYATFKATNTSQPANAETPPDSDDNKTWGGCYSCHEDAPAVGGPIGSNHDNHHLSILGNSSAGTTTFQKLATPFDLSYAPGGRACFVCHVINVSTGSPLRPTIIDGGTGLPVRAMELRNSTIETDPIFGTLEPFAGNTNITINGTGCEKCHSVLSIHSIQAGGYNPSGGPQGLGHIQNTTDCLGCHSSWLPADTAPVGPIIPTMDSINPAVIAVNTATTITIAGENFAGDYTSAVIIDGGAPIAPAQITDTQMTVNIPALSVGTHTLQVAKDGNIMSKLSTLVVVPTVTLSSATLSGQTLTISGSGFGPEPGANAQQYVTTSNAGNVYYSANIISWGDNQIVATVSAAGDAVELLTATNGLAKAPIGIAPSPAKITVDPATATLNTGGSQTFAASGVLGTVTWSSNNPAVGTISSTGKFTAAGPGTVTITATAGTASGTATVTVTGIKVTSPNGGENWKRGTAQKIKWTSVGNAGANVKVELLKGKSATTIASSVPNSGSYAWKLPQSVATDYKIRITSTSNKLYTDTSDNNFQISK